MNELIVQKVGRREIYLVKGPRGCGKTQYIQAEKNSSSLKWFWTTEAELKRFSQELNAPLEDTDILVVQESEWSCDLYGMLKTLVTEDKIALRAMNRKTKVVKNKISKIFVEVPV